LILLLCAKSEVGHDEENHCLLWPRTRKSLLRRCSDGGVVAVYKKVAIIDGRVADDGKVKPADEIADRVAERDVPSNGVFWADSRGQDVLKIRVGVGKGQGRWIGSVSWYGGGNEDGEWVGDVDLFLLAEQKSE
jgi:hypothetical protein